MARATMRFYAELNDFLAPMHRRRDLEHRFVGHPTVKDAIESKGVPHSEVHAVVVNGHPVDMDAHLSDGDRVSVYPMFTGIDADALPHLQPERTGVSRFVADVHLGKLARRLRLLGFDTLWPRDASDAELAQCAADEGRVLLTRDRGLLKRRMVERGFFVRDDDPLAQAVDVVVHLGLASQIAAFRRCTVCNGELESVAKHEIESELPARTRREFTAFHRCTSCGRVYWEGSHHARLVAVVDEIRARAAGSTTKPSSGHR